MTDNRTIYERKVQERSKLRYLVGLIARWWLNLKYAKARKIARKRGAIIGEGVIMPIKLAKKLNNNIIIGNHVSILTTDFSSFDFPIKIGNNVIIGANVKIVMDSHKIDSPEWERFRPNKDLEIDDYVWLCPDSVVLPSCSKIGYGAVVGANAVVTKDVPQLSVIGGNPAQFIRNRQCVHDKLIVESLSGGDYKIYKEIRHKKKLY